MHLILQNISKNVKLKIQLEKRKEKVEGRS